MTEDILSIETEHPDVASLAQGYMNRADGERLLLPLGTQCKRGAGVRFVVYLADGTPAFAGSGLCEQVSDQGGTVPAEQRFETLLDTLQFDERSRPVYDYIVAVRNAAYQPASEPAGAGDLEVGEDVELQPEGEAQPSPFSDAGEHVVSGWPTEGGGATTAPPPSAPAAEQAEAWLSSLAAGEVPSFMPPPLPTGLLARPARTTHWQPAPPRRPTPRPATGLFRYAGGGLPRPARPPRPDLDPGAWVRRAPRPEG